jgi:large subunit ribosomal protein L22
MAHGRPESFQPKSLGWKKPKHDVFWSSTHPSKALINLPLLFLLKPVFRGEKMPHWAYSVSGLDPEKTARASGRELRISSKNSREVCRAIRGMKLQEAKTLLENVVAKKVPIKFTRHVKEVGHRHGVYKGSVARYPVKVASKLLEVLEAAEANAEYKGLNLEKVRIEHAAVQKARSIRKNIPRAFGRSSRFYGEMSHLEIVLGEI